MCNNMRLTTKRMVPFWCVVFVSLMGPAKATSSADVSLQATPNTLLKDSSQNLNVNCTFTKSPGFDITSLISLTLSKTTASQTNVFEEMAIIDAFAGSKITVNANNLGGNITGGMDAYGHAFINFQWTSQSGGIWSDIQTVAGMYQCQAFGLDKKRHPVTSSITAHVVATDVDLYGALQKIEDLQTCQAHKDASASVLFQHHSNYSGGHDYFLSPAIPINVSKAYDVCYRYGGYLAEINDKEEMKFVTDFLFQAAPKEYVVVGATDAKAEGGWRFLHSGNVVNYFHWADGEPTEGATEDCMVLIAYAGFVQDFVQNYHHRNYYNGMYDSCCTCWQPQRFLCEIP